MDKTESYRGRKSTARELWIKGELLARKFLKKRGYKILQRNFTAKTGEIDIVAYENDIIVFIEVKTRFTDDFGPPELAVTREKKRKIIKTALYFLMGNNLDEVDYRFDVVSILFEKGKKNPKIELFQGVFASDNL